MLTRRPARNAPATSEWPDVRFWTAEIVDDDLQWNDRDVRADSVGWVEDDVESVTIATPGICSA